MTADRPVSLRLDVGNHSLGDTPEHHSGTPRKTTPEHRDAFLSALHRPSKTPLAEHDSPAHVTDDTRGANDLPRGIPPVTLPLNPAPYSGHLELSVQHELCESLERLLVSDDGNDAEVRLEIKNDTLPGVSVRLFETQGRLTVCFICSVDTVRRRLDTQLADLAQQLANRLQRDTLMQIQTDDPGDPRLSEALACPEP